MGNYYFIEKKGNKEGPFKLEQLKEQTIYYDDLVWRSDNDQWKKASEFEELQNNLIIKPPPTPKEKKVAEINDAFLNRIVKELLIVYVFASILVGIVSYLVAQSSWDNYLKDTGGKYLGNNSSNNYSSSSISYSELEANKRFPSYMPGENNEAAYGKAQGFLFRPFKAFFSTVYLTLEEQESSGTLFVNLVLSSFASLSFVFVIIGIVYYSIKRGKVNEDLKPVVNNETDL